MIYLVKTSVAQRVLCVIVAWLVINELESMWGGGRSWPVSGYFSGIFL